MPTTLSTHAVNHLEFERSSPSSIVMANPPGFTEPLEPLPVDADVQDRIVALQSMVDALSVPESVLTSGSSVGGIGSFTGRGLMTLGEATLRGFRNINERLKLRTITSKLSKSDGSDASDDVYDVLLELQRYVNS